MKRLSLCIAALFLMMTAIHATAEEQGKQVSREGFDFVLPVRWNIPKNEQPRGRRNAKEKIVFMTKDGYQLDRIEFRKRLLTAEFGHTKRRLTRGMMPQEMAEVVLNDLELDETLKNLKMLENKPAMIGGIPGFRLAVSFRSNGMLQYQAVYYGFRKDDMFYTVLYMAPKRHYFETNLGTFEQVVKSFKAEADGQAAWSPGGAN